MPIFLAACFVLQVFFIATPFPALQGHEFDFQFHQCVSDIVS
jgi:hypothetical protein